MREIRPSRGAAPFLRGAGMALLLVFSLGCAGMGHRIVPDPGVEPLTPDDPSYEETIQVQYLGTGGNLLWRGRHGLLTAPLYSNPGLLRVGLWHIYPDTALINRLHPRRNTTTQCCIMLHICWILQHAWKYSNINRLRPSYWLIRQSTALKSNTLPV